MKEIPSENPPHVAKNPVTVEPLYVKHTREPDGTEEFDEEGNKITQGYRERLVLDNNAIILDLLCALQVALKTINKQEKRLSMLEMAALKTEPDHAD